MKVYVCYTHRYDDEYDCECGTEFWHIVFINEQDAKDWVVKYNETVKAYDEFCSESGRQINQSDNYDKREQSRIEHGKRLQGWLDSNSFVRELISAGCLSGYGLAELNYTYPKYKELELEQK